MNSGTGSLIAFFALISILSVGGSNSVIPEISRHAVEQQHWLTGGEFTDVFAITQATPGPSNLIVALIGYKVAGIPGALAAQLAMMLPAAVLMFMVSRFWVSSAQATWHLALERGIGPIAVGLILASGWTIAESAGLSPGGYLTAATCSLLFWKTDISPIPILALAGILGGFNLI